ncbi:hypothetical protein RRG08_009007 [Elysia crispata]|uniref:Uncharacterized protein n=1 Tax=Elysia crispata TaxID=231223 RepID=A0AAE1DBW1_9GAST|nr:hypothetical protein RRG08_009007 [Elysia crispata]
MVVFRLSPSSAVDRVISQDQHQTAITGRTPFFTDNLNLDRLDLAHCVFRANHESLSQTSHKSSCIASKLYAWLPSPRQITGEGQGPLRNYNVSMRQSRQSIDRVANSVDNKRF